MRTEYPKKANLGWVSKIRNQNMAVVLAKMLCFYTFINLIFSVLYYIFRVLASGTSFFDYVYFSFVTSLAIGYGDFVPLTVLGKLLVIIHSGITAVYFALMISILSIKMLYPRNLIKFSRCIIYNSQTDTLIFRVINTNKEPLINPELRISVTEHNTGESSPGVFSITTDNNIAYLGKLDYSYTIKNTFGNFNVYEEAKKAVQFNKKTDSLESRFRINMSLTGSYGLNQIALRKKYYANEIIPGKCFKPITYSKQVYIKKEITYKKIKNFWEDFETVEE